ncbi:MAG: hypothetical protein NZV14_15670 [Bryobacteraceae bacterium]|nr:hypothetical protein [Bryobacteraceae bacterium]MDW8379600.1 hypothetical protein [Bryobacterales bacterium]
MKIRSMRAMVGLMLVSAPVISQDFSEILATASRQKQRNAKVTDLRFRCVPQDCRVRPLETLVVQVLVDGEIPSTSGEPRRGRLRRAPGPMKVVESEGGWVSKPFKFQGEDPGGFVDSGGGALQQIFSKVAGDFIVQDSFLYSAPPTPGVYTLENDSEGVKKQLNVTVTEEAPSQVKPEEYHFGPENRQGERFRKLAEHWAPVLAQETWWQPKSDIPVRFDFDGDLIGDNNWDNMEKGSSQAYVYYAVIETSTHWFLIYNVFHARDYSDKCVAGSCHENDNEGLILTVQRDGSEFGRLLAMETLAHNNVYSYVNDGAIRPGAHSIDGRVEFMDETHPVVFIESGGHGIYGSSHPSHSRYRVSSDEFVSGTGITFVYKGVAERAKHANDRRVGYELLPILTHWWVRTTIEENQRMFDEFAPYAPFGGRPGVKFPRIGTTFLGRKESANKAKPFWGWHDSRTLKNRINAPGQWGLDPAYAVSRNLTFPSGMAFSLDYTYNPYLGIGDQDAKPAASTLIQIGTPIVQAPVNTAPPTNPAGEAASARVSPSAPTSILPSAIAPLAREGWVEVQGTVDGVVNFRLRSGEVTPEVISGQPVQGLKVDLGAALPVVGAFSCVVEKRAGRGTVRLIEQPSDKNGFTAQVRVEDPQRGADNYLFRVRWVRQ